jgi:hypothetical protein
VGDTQDFDVFGPHVSPLETRLGGKKAVVAVAHKILVIIYHLLLEGTFYEEKRNVARIGNRHHMLGSHNFQGIGEISGGEPIRPCMFLHINGQPISVLRFLI